MGQLSFYSADARPRALTDLEGLLCGAGYAELFGRGSAARLTVLLGPPPAPVDDPDGVREDDPAIDAPPDEPDGNTPAPPDAVRDDAAPGHAQAPVDPDPITRWRAHAVQCALRARGVPAQVGWAGDGRVQVRTAFRADLVGLARAWTGDGGAKAVPPTIELDGPRLRLWVLAAGARERRAYTLGLDPDAPGGPHALLTASRRAGLGARLAGVGHAPVLRIVGSRRQGRLGELVGRPPRDLVDGVWPV